MSKYDKLKNDNAAQRELEKQLNFASQGMDEISEDVRRTSDIYNDAETVLNDIDKRFEQATHLNKADISFLFLLPLYSVSANI